VAVASLVFVLVSARKKRTAHLKERFGPEYDHTVTAQGGPRKAEARLEAREKRVEKLNIKPVPAELRDRFASSWRNVQARFVDEPGAAVLEADGLVRKVMESRGYPVGSFEQGAEDVSVDHPHLMANYRAAHEIARKKDRGEVSTEDLRQAMRRYRSFFDRFLAV
jgi:hypothetical protein